MIVQRLYTCWLVHLFQQYYLYLRKMEVPLRTQVGTNACRTGGTLLKNNSVPSFSSTLLYPINLYHLSTLLYLKRTEKYLLRVPHGYGGLRYISVTMGTQMYLKGYKWMEYKNVLAYAGTELFFKMVLPVRQAFVPT